MSIQIVGSNDKKIKLITEDKIESIILNQEILYNLYKEKYVKKNGCKLFTNDYEHLMTQLIKTFFKYDNSLTYNQNLNKFIKHLNYMNKNNNIIVFINLFMINFKILDKLDLAIKKLLIKVFKNKYKNDIDNIKLNNNYLIDLHFILKIMRETKNNKEVEDNLKKIEIELNNLENILNSLKIINMKTNKKIDLDDKSNKCKFLNNLIDTLDLIIINTNIIKTNILKIDSIINIITELIYKLYQLL